jgi:hypothetical protein
VLEFWERGGADEKREAIGPSIIAENTAETSVTDVLPKLKKRDQMAAASALISRLLGLCRASQ